MLEWRLDPTGSHRLAEVTGFEQPVVVVCSEGYASSLAAASLHELASCTRVTWSGGTKRGWRGSVRALRGVRDRRFACTTEVMAYLLAATAAFVNALTAVLQRIGVETAPESATLRLSLMAHAIKRRIWLIGFGLMLVQFGLQATALRFGELSVVQPVLTTELIFLLLILGMWFHYRLGVQEWLGVVGHRGRAGRLLSGV